MPAFQRVPGADVPELVTEDPLPASAVPEAEPSSEQVPPVKRKTGKQAQRRKPKAKKS
jgi:hypothetical protein